MCGHLANAWWLGQGWEERSQEQWQKLKFPRLKLNLDGAFWGSKRGIAVVLRNWEGTIVVVASKPLPATPNAKFAEMRTILLGLELASIVGVTNILEMDYFVAVVRLRHHGQDLSPLGHLLICQKSY